MFVNFSLLGSTVGVSPNENLYLSISPAVPFQQHLPCVVNSLKVAMKPIIFGNVGIKAEIQSDVSLLMDLIISSMKRETKLALRTHIVVHCTISYSVLVVSSPNCFHRCCSRLVLFHSCYILKYSVPRWELTFLQHP